MNDSIDVALESVRSAMGIWLSTRDAENRDVDGTVIQLGTERGDCEVGALIDARVRSFRERNIDTVLVTLPPVAGTPRAAGGAKSPRFDAYTRC